MKRILFALAIAAATLSSPASASVTVSIGQPGFYGRLDIGGFPAPALIYPQPIIIQGGPYGAPPLYLRVPPRHASHWRQYCHRYQACGHPVYFVRDSWYHQEYVPQYRARHHDHYDRRDYREDRRDYREDRRDYRQERRHDRRHDHDDHGHRGGRDHRD